MDLHSSFEILGETTDHSKQPAARVSAVSGDYDRTMGTPMPGFPPRGSTLYVFSIDGESLHTGDGQKETDSNAPAVRQDQGMGGKP